MEKFEKIFKGYRGLLIFYIIVALLAFMLTKRLEDINSNAQSVKPTETYYA